MLNAAILEAVRDWKRSEDWLADWMERRDAWRAAAWREAERAERQRQAAERKPEPDGERRPPRRIGIDRTKEAMGRAFQILAAPAKSKPH
jgi:hypothetical protein